MEPLVWFPVGREEGHGPVFLPAVASLSHTQVTKYLNIYSAFVGFWCCEPPSHLLWDFFLKKFLHKLLAAQGVVSQVCFESLRSGERDKSFPVALIFTWPNFMPVNSPCTYQSGEYLSRVRSLQRGSTAPYTDIHARQKSPKNMTVSSFIPTGS